MVKRCAPPCPDWSLKMCASRLAFPRGRGCAGLGAGADDRAAPAATGSRGGAGGDGPTTAARADAAGLPGQRRRGSATFKSTQR